MQEIPHHIFSIKQHKFSAEVIFGFLLHFDEWRALAQVMFIWVAELWARMILLLMNNNTWQKKQYPTTSYRILLRFSVYIRNLKSNINI